MDDPTAALGVSEPGKVIAGQRSSAGWPIGARQG
jgi:hypothetical protein